MTDEQTGAGRAQVHRRTLRLTFRSAAGEVRLVRKERLDMICPPSVGEWPEAGRNGGYWVETQDGAGGARFFRVLHDPLRSSVEVHSPDGTIRREFGPAEDATFEVLVPDDPDATSVVLMGDAEPRRATRARRQREATGSYEMARFDLTSDDGNDEGAGR